MIGNRRPIGLKVTSDGGSVTSREAVSLGLIVTELILNAVKHAFPQDNTDRRITDAYDVAGTNWKLSVADNGIAGAPGLFPSKAGLGTSIVNALAQQLDAKVEISSGPERNDVSVTHATFVAMPHVGAKTIELRRLVNAWACLTTPSGVIAPSVKTRDRKHVGLPRRLPGRNDNAPGVTRPPGGLTSVKSNCTCECAIRHSSACSSSAASITWKPPSARKPAANARSSASSSTTRTSAASCHGSRAGTSNVNAADKPKHDDHNQHQAQDAAEPSSAVPSVAMVTTKAAKQNDDQQNKEKRIDDRSPRSRVPA